MKLIKKCYRYKKLIGKRIIREFIPFWDKNGNYITSDKIIYIYK
jgi:hypothetical protein